MLFSRSSSTGARFDQRRVDLAWSHRGIDKSQVTLVIEDAVMAGNIRLPGATFQVRYVGPDDLHSIRQIDESQFPPEGATARKRHSPVSNDAG